MMTFNIKRKLLLVPIILLGVNWLIGYEVYKSHEQLISSEQWVRHTENAIFKTANIYSLSKDIEASSWRYVVTNDSSFLLPLKTAPQIINYIQQLKQFTQNNPHQQIRIDELHNYMQQRIAIAAQTVKLRQNEGIQAALAFIATQQGIQYAAEIKEICKDIQQEEMMLLKIRNETNSQSVMVFNRFLAAMYVSIALFTLLLIFLTNKILNQTDEKSMRAAELVVANTELIFQNKEKEKRAAELIIANKELQFQNEEKEKRAAELIIANGELKFQSLEKGKRAAELIIANKELQFQNEEKEKRAAELIIANGELKFQSLEKGKRAAELIETNKELVFQYAEKGKRAAELIIANKELVFQDKEKSKRAAELLVANNKLMFENGEKEKRAAELIIANNELDFQNKEKEKRAAELIIANKELVFQNKEKSNRAAELILANGELQVQDKEKGKRAAELIIANKELQFQNQEKQRRAEELALSNNKLKKADEGLKRYIEGLEQMMFITSHKVRQPVANILSISHILHDFITMPSKLQEMLNYIKESAETLDNFTKELTTFMDNLDQRNKN